MRKELFGAEPALGQWLRVGEWRFRVVGILESEGHSIGVDTSEMVMIPVAYAQMIFNNPSLFRIIVEGKSRERIPATKQDILKIIRNRHQGEEDITVITQDAVLATFDRIFRALTFTLAGIASISLVVAGILIMNVMLVVVTQRTAEIGLLRALGAQRRQVLWLFLGEAAALPAIGGLAGLALGAGGAQLLHLALPALPVLTPVHYVIIAEALAISIGIAAGILPAQRAAGMDPVEALRAE